MKPQLTPQISKAEITAVESSLTLHYLLFLFTHLFTLTRLNQHLDGTEGSLLTMQNSGVTVYTVFMIRKKIKTAYNNTKEENLSGRMVIA